LGANGCWAKPKLLLRPGPSGPMNPHPEPLCDRWGEKDGEEKDEKRKKGNGISRRT